MGDLCVPLWLILLLAGMIVATYLPRRWLWLSILCIFLMGFLPGVFTNHFWGGVALGAFFVVFVVPGCLLTRYYRERAQKWFKSSGK